MFGSEPEESERNGAKLDVEMWTECVALVHVHMRCLAAGGEATSNQSLATRRAKHLDADPVP